MQYAGYAAVTWAIYKLSTMLYGIIFPFLLATPRDLKALAGARWAVVTGSTDGIGKAYAFELAHKGFDLVLVSRTQSKLDTTAEEIKQKHSGITIKTIAFDFSETKLDVYQKRLLDELEKLEIGVLINNVGLSYEYPERLDRVDGGLERVINVNVVNTLPPTILSAMVLKQMAKRNCGIIVNISSSAAYHPLFYWSIYSASKQYINQLSTILRKEYADTNIIIQTVCPMMVATKMAKVRKTSLLVPSATTFARSAVRTIGLVDETTGCLSHEIQCNVAFGLVPKMIVDKLVEKNSRMTRAKAIKKRDEAQKAE